MSHVSDFTQSEEKIVYDLINADNESNFTSAEISLGAAVPIDGKVRMTLTGVPGSGYGSTVDVQYTRIKIQEFLDLRYPEGLTLQQGDSLTYGDLLPEINAALGTAIPVDSIVNVEIGAWEGVPNEIRDLILTIKPSSRVYQGQGTFKLDGNDIPLVDVLTVHILSGLNLPRNKIQLSELFSSNVLAGF